MIVDSEETFTRLQALLADRPVETFCILVISRSGLVSLLPAVLDLVVGLEHTGEDISGFDSITFKHEFTEELIIFEQSHVIKFAPAPHYDDSNPRMFFRGTSDHLRFHERLNWQSSSPRRGHSAGKRARNQSRKG